MKWFRYSCRENKNTYKQQLYIVHKSDILWNDLDTVVEKIKIDILCSMTFIPENRVVNETVENKW
jgi:hypothetical protein